MYQSSAPLRRFLLPLLTAAVAVLVSTSVFASDRLQAMSIPSTRATETLLLDITLAGDRVVTAGDHGVILYSDDQGRHWQQADVPFSVMLTALDFTSSQQGWAAGHDGLLARTDNGGESWLSVMNGDDINQLRLARLEQLYAQMEVQVDAQPDNDELLDQLDTLSFQLEDAQIAVEDGPAIPLLDIWFADAQTGYVLGGYGLLLRTVDGGQSWQYWGDRLPNPDSFHLNSMTRDHQGTLYIAGEAGQIFRSVDQGISWELLDSPYDGSFFAVVSQQDQLYLLGLRGHLFNSANGIDWQQVGIDTDKTLTAAVPLTREMLLLGQGGVLLTGSEDSFRVVDSGVRRSFSAGVAIGKQWLLVGERGITQLSAEQQEAGRE